MNEKPWVKTYAGGKPNYCTPEHEPLCYLRDDIDRPFGGFEHCDKDDAGAFPVYLAPPKREWVGLTDEERKQIVSCINDPFEWSHAVEAKLKEKNGG